MILDRIMLRESGRLRHESRTVAQSSYELIGFLHDKSTNITKAETSRKMNAKVAYHTPCHTRSLYASPPAPELLRQVGLDVEIVNFEGCCGIAGTYGFKKGYEGFDVSMDVGEELFAKIHGMDPDFVVTESSVCRTQIEQGLSLPVKHPLELLTEAYDLSRAERIIRHERALDREDYG